MAQEIGAILGGKYRVERQLGSGGFATTFLATGPGGVRCVVKTLSLGGADGWKRVELFEREARVLRQLNHPRIPRFMDFFTVEKAGGVEIHLVQEFVEGENLAELVAGGRRFTSGELLDVAEEMGGVLRYLHALSPPIFHRDIKPSNIMRTPAGAYHLVDFGAVRDKMRDDEQAHAGGSTIVGTYGYMPLEQFEGRATPASDIYSLGATLVFLATHREPWTLEKQGLRLDFSAAAQLPRPVDRLLRRMIEPDWKVRLADPQALLWAIGQVRQRQDPVRIARAVPLLAAALALLVPTGLGLFLAGVGARRQENRPLVAQAPPVPTAPPAPLLPPPPEARDLSGQAPTCRPETLMSGNVLRPMSAGTPLDDEVLPAGAFRRLGTTRLRHDGRVNAAVLAPDGETLISADMALHFWSTREGRELGQAVGHCNWVSALAFSPDGSALYSGSLDGTIRVWNPTTRAQIKWIEAFGPVTAMALSPDGEFLLAGVGDHRLVVFDRRAGKALMIAEAAPDPRNRWESVAGSPDGSLVAGADGRQVLIFRASTGRPLPGPPVDALPTRASWVHFTDNERLLIAGADRIATWNLTRQAFESSVAFRYVSGGLRAALNGDGNTLAIAGTDRQIQLLDWRTGKVHAPLSAGGWYVQHLAFSRDGATLISGGWDTKVRLWDWRTGRERLPDNAPVNVVETLAYSADGTSVSATYVWTRERRTWLVDRAGAMPAIDRGPERLRFALVRKGGGGGWSAPLHEGQRDLLRAFFDASGYRNPPTAIVEGGNGRPWVMSSEPSSVRFFDLATHQLRLEVPMPAAEQAGDAAPQGGTLRVWTEGDGDAHEEFSVTSPRRWLFVHAAIARGGRRVALLDERGRGQIWDHEARRILGTFTAPGAAQITFSSDGKRLYVLRGQFETRDGQTGALLGTLESGHRGQVTAFALAPDGKSVATGGTDSTVLLWRL